MKPIPRWLVQTEHLVRGRWLHFFRTREQQRKFARKHHGEKSEVTRSKH